MLKSANNMKMRPVDEPAGLLYWAGLVHALFS